MGLNALSAVGLLLEDTTCASVLVGIHSGRAESGDEVATMKNESQ